MKSLWLKLTATAYYYLGQAMHPVMDMYCPVHAWGGRSNPPNWDEIDEGTRYENWVNGFIKQYRGIPSDMTYYRDPYTGNEYGVGGPLRKTVENIQSITNGYWTKPFYLWEHWQ